MRIHSLTLLPFLLLPAQVLLVVGAPKSREGQSSMATKDHWIPLGKPQIVQKDREHKPLVNGVIVTPDLASCTVTLMEHEEGTAMKAVCSRMDHDFSCVFTSNPTSCIEGCKSDMIYWTQIAHHLSCQRNLCEDAHVVLRSRVCSRRFPESNFKLVYSTLISHLNQCDEDITPWWHIIIHEAPPTSTTEVIPFFPVQGIQTVAPVPTEVIQVTKTTPTVPIVIEQTTPTEEVNVEETTTTQQPKTEQTTVTVPIVIEQTTPTEEVKVEEITTTQQPKIEQTTATVPIVIEQTTPTEQVKVEEITTTQQPKIEQTTATVPIVIEQTTPTEQIKLEEITTTQQPQVEETTPTESFYNEVTTPKPNCKDDSGIKIKQTIIYQSSQHIGQKKV
ncbi:fibroblast growth factor-binding protein 1-like [Diceros bicornis minor]|uniref:fibroblast growth factor-binding protein 1-like n=1 Tax=Diceros bicornis minor TaxID=77932 RepID=UPI0026EEF8F4|nr:fibroblast growth factor-binding protein 1-like [Diceros bicornis minor]